MAWAIGVAAILLVWPAIWNGYPLVFADSGTYLGQALLGYAGWDRPPFYSLFLLGLHWRLSLWPIVLGQGLLLAHLLHLVLRTQGHPGPVPLLLTALALAMFTGLPFFASQIQPDLFTGVVVLCAWLIGFRQSALSLAERRYVMLLATLAIIVHQSHVPLALGLALLGALLWIAGACCRRCGPCSGCRCRRCWRCWRWSRQLGRPWRRRAIALWLRLPGHPHAVRRERQGLAGPALCRDRGEETQFRVCALHGDLGGGHNDFLWTLDGPLYSVLGGPKTWAPEASAIVYGVVMEDPVAMLRAAVANTLEQLGRTATGDGLNPGSARPDRNR